MLKYRMFYGKLLKMRKTFNSKPQHISSNCAPNYMFVDENVRLGVGFGYIFLLSFEIHRQYNVMCHMIVDKADICG